MELVEKIQRIFKQFVWVVVLLLAHSSSLAIRFDAPRVSSSSICQDVLGGEQSPSLFDILPLKVSGTIIDGISVQVEDPKLPKKVYYLLPNGIEKSRWAPVQFDVGGSEYNLIDVGYRQINDLHREALDKIKEEWRKNSFKRDFEIRTPKSISKKAKLAEEVRWVVHSKVLDMYARKKPYLNQSDFNELEAFNRFKTSSNVLTVMESSNKSLEQLNQSEISDLTVATIQISFPEDVFHHLPDVDSLAGARSNYVPFVYLPFVVRVAQSEMYQFIGDMWDFFKGQKIVEFARYAIFKETSKELNARLLLEATQLAAGTGAKYIVAATDSATYRLFTRKYYFKAFKKIPSLSVKSEYLVYLEIDSPEYRRVISELKESL